ncbi:MAG: exopolysaccharide biosynthesis protein, partial [Clostridia bacterium]|nr:exopolysaccharide biosynthesis protein [Clostridia bacterium]
MNAKFKKLLSDAGLFTVSNLGSKLVVFFLVPLYTHVLSTWEYGVADLLTSTNNILVPILTLSISEAVLRFPFDKDKARGHILCNATVIILVGTVVACIVSPLMRLMSVELVDYWMWLPVIFVVATLNTLLSNYARGTDRVRIFAIKG